MNLKIQLLVSILFPLRNSKLSQVPPSKGENLAFLIKHQCMSFSQRHLHNFLLWEILNQLWTFHHASIFININLLFPDAELPHIRSAPCIQLLRLINGGIMISSALNLSDNLSHAADNFRLGVRQVVAVA